MSTQLPKALGAFILFFLNPKETSARFIYFLCSCIDLVCRTIDHALFIEAHY